MSLSLKYHKNAPNNFWEIIKCHFFDLWKRNRAFRCHVKIQLWHQYPHHLYFKLSDQGKNSSEFLGCFLWKLSHRRSFQFFRNNDWNIWILSKYSPTGQKHSWSYWIAVSSRWHVWKIWILLEEHPWVRCLISFIIALREKEERGISYRFHLKLPIKFFKLYIFLYWKPGQGTNNIIVWWIFR